MGCGPSKARIDLLIAEAVEANYEGKRRPSAFDSEDTETSDVDQQSTIPKSSMIVTSRSTKGPPPFPFLSGDQQSFARQSLDLILPTADDQTTKLRKSSSRTGPTGWCIWKTKNERQDFITATLIVLSGNGLRDISHCRVEMFFVRLGMEQMAYRAGFAVMKSPNESHRSEAMAAHTYVARQFAVDQKTAFMELMFDIEALLESHLHNGEVHISRYGIGAGQNELESQMRNRAIKKIEEPFVPSDVAQAMNGLTEPYLYHTNALTMTKHSSRSGFVVGEVESQKSAPSYRTTGGVGAVPYNNWMQPMPPSRARQMHSHVLARPRRPSYTTSYRTHHAAAAAAAARGYYPGAKPPANGTEGFVPISRQNLLPPTLSSTSSISDGGPPTSSAPRSRSDSSCYSPTQTLPHPSPLASVPGPANLDLDLSEVLDQVAHIAGGGAAPLSSHNLLPPEPPLPRPSARRRSSAGSLASSQQSYTYSSAGKQPAATKVALHRPMKSTPNINMRYHGLQKLEEDLDESDLFPRKKQL